jgi:hypothetical protein
MDALARFAVRVSRLEAEGAPLGTAERISAIRSLIDDIRIAPWATPLERQEAQGLVIRLERLLWKAQERPRPP